ncbi:MAG: flagellar basal body L-ring protein FlgH [Longimicrobiales bacterium]
MRRWLMVCTALTVPIGVRAQDAAAPVAPAAVPAPPVLDLGWLADGRRFQVGDLLTVVVDEFTTASADRSTTELQDRTADAGGSFSVNRQGTDGSLQTFLGTESTRQGRDLRQDRLTSEVSVRVTAIEPNGALRVEGSKTLAIDDHEQQVTVRGFVRPQDITALNTVESWRIAEAEVLYSTDGTLGNTEKSMLMRLLGWIL